MHQQDLIISGFIVIMLIVITALVFFRVGKDNKKCKETNCSFECSPGLGCHLVNKKANEKKGIYNDYNKCTQSCSTPAPTPFSFACSPGLGCHKVNEAPNKAKGLFADIQSCSQSCSDPIAFSFACSPGLGCHKVNEAPNKDKGLFADIQSCSQSCSLPTPDYNIRSLVYTLTNNTPGQSLPQNILDYLVSYFMEESETWASFSKGDPVSQLYFIKLVVVEHIGKVGGINMVEENVACIANFFKGDTQNAWVNFLKDDNKNQLDFLNWAVPNLCA